MEDDVKIDSRVVVDDSIVDYRDMVNRFCYRERESFP
jgi:hypothetical protein